MHSVPTAEHLNIHNQFFSGFDISFTLDLFPAEKHLFTTTPTRISLFVASPILVHLFNIGTGTIFLEAFEDVFLMGEKEGPAN